MIVICLIFINLNFFENFFQDMMLQIQMSQFIILDIQLSKLYVMFCVQVVVQWEKIYFNCLKTLVGHNYPKVSTSEPGKFSVFLTQSFVKIEDKMKVIKFEPIEIYHLLIIFHYMNTKYLFDEIHDI